MLLGVRNFKKLKNSYKNHIKFIFLLLINKDRIKVVLKNGKILYWNNQQVRNYIVAFNLKYSNFAEVEFYPELDKMAFNYQDERFTFYGFLEDDGIYHEFINFEYNQSVLHNSPCIVKYKGTI